MSRRWKNVIMLSVLLIYACLLVFTVISAKGETHRTSDNIKMDNRMDSNMPPDMEEKLENPEDAKSLEKESDATKIDQKRIRKEKSQNAPSESDDETEVKDRTKQDKSQENGGNGKKFYREPFNNSESSKASESLSIVYYVLFGIESFTIAITAMYLILSFGNKKTLSEMLNSMSNIIIFTISIITLTSIITLSSSYIASRLIANNTMPKTVEFAPQFDNK